jgi:hypothetical protein
MLSRIFGAHGSKSQSKKICPSIDKLLTGHDIDYLLNYACQRPNEVSELKFIIEKLATAILMKKGVLREKTLWVALKEFNGSLAIFLEPSFCPPAKADFPGGLLVEKDFCKHLAASFKDSDANPIYYFAYLYDRFFEGAYLQLCGNLLNVVDGGRCKGDSQITAFSNLLHDVVSEIVFLHSYSKLSEDRNELIPDFRYGPTFVDVEGMGLNISNHGVSVWAENLDIDKFSAFMIDAMIKRFNRGDLKYVAKA